MEDTLSIFGFVHFSDNAVCVCVLCLCLYGVCAHVNRSWCSVRAREPKWEETPNRWNMTHSSSERYIPSAAWLVCVCVRLRHPLWWWGVEICRSLRALVVVHLFWAAEVSLNSSVTSSSQRALWGAFQPAVSWIYSQFVFCLHLLVRLQLIMRRFPQPNQAEDAGSFTRWGSRLHCSTLHWP